MADTGASGHNKEKGGIELEGQNELQCGRVLFPILRNQGPDYTVSHEPVKFREKVPGAFMQ